MILYEALNIPIEDFHLIKEIISKKELEGFNITIPHKERIIPYLDYVDEQAINAGAVNTVLIKDGKWIGIIQMVLVMLKDCTAFIQI